MEIRVQYWNRLAVAKNPAPGADWVVGRVVREDGDISVEFTLGLSHSSSRSLPSDAESTRAETHPRQAQQRSQAALD
jgi:hypothetical protein